LELGYWKIEIGNFPASIIYFLNLLPFSNILLLIEIAISIYTHLTPICSSLGAKKRIRLVYTE